MGGGSSCVWGVAELCCRGRGPNRTPSAWTRHPTSQLCGLRQVAPPLCLGSHFYKTGAVGVALRALQEAALSAVSARNKSQLSLPPYVGTHAHTHTVALGPSPNKRGQESASQKEAAGLSIPEQKGQGVGAGDGAPFQSPGLCEGVGGKGRQPGAARTPPPRAPEQAASPPPPLLGG